MFKFFLKTISKIKIIFWRLIVPLYVKSLGVKLGKNVRFYGFPIIAIENGGSIEIGNNVVLCSRSEYTALGVAHPVVLRAIGGKIRIGDDSGISGASICAFKSIQIGNSCLLGANVTISDTDFHPIYPINRRYNSEINSIGISSVKISDNVFLGQSAIVLKGVIVGENSVVGAGSLVVKTVEPNTIVGGVPSKFIRKL